MLALGVTFLCGFFLTPFLLGHLGPDQYSIFVLAQAVVGFLPLLTLGVPATLTQLLSKSVASENWTGLERSVSAGLVFLSGAGAVTAALSAVLVVFLPQFVELDDDLITPARVVFALLLFHAALAFPLLVYRTLYQAAQSFVIPNAVRIVFVLARTALIYFFFVTGNATLAVWAGLFVLGELAESLFLASRVRRVLPELRASSRATSWPEVRSLVQLSVWVLMGSLGYLLYQNTDYLLINWFVGPEQVAHYNLVARWDPLLRALVGTIANPVVPIAAALWASKDEVSLRDLFLRTTRYCMYLALPSCLLLAVFAEPFLRTWAGADYAGDAPVLVILMVPLIFSLAHGPAASVYIGTGRTRFNGVLTLGLAIANVVLSVYFVRVLGWGLEGIALGTASTYLLRTGILSPRYCSGLIGLPFGQYVREVWVRPGLMAVPMLLTALAVRRWQPPNSLLEVVGTMVGAALIFGVTVWAFGLTDAEKAGLRRVFRRLSNGT